MVKVFTEVRVAILEYRHSPLHVLHLKCHLNKGMYVLLVKYKVKVLQMQKNGT